MIQNLPHEILYIISSKLDARDLCNFLFINKKNKSLDNEYLWRNMCKNNYMITTKSKNKTWLSTYKKYYNTVCIYCFKKTSRKTIFERYRVCMGCDIIHHPTLCYSQIKLLHALSDSEISTLPFRYKKNPYNSRNHMKLFLKRDIEKIINKKTGIKETINEILIANKRDKLYNIIFKFTFIESELRLRYNIILTNMFMYFGKYKNLDKLYNRFIKTNSVYSDKIIKYCLELDFIISNGFVDDIEYWGRSFSGNLLYVLLTTDTTTLQCSEYIINKVNTLLVAFKDAFNRKREVVCEIGSSYLKNAIVYEYIIRGYKTIKFIKDTVEENKFFHDTININSIILIQQIYNFNVVVDQEYLNRLILNKWVHNNRDKLHLIPKNIQIKYLM